jgi:hypothetical protein
LVLEEKRLRNYGAGAARSKQAGHGGEEVDEKNDQIAHRRIVAGPGILRNHGLRAHRNGITFGLSEKEWKSVQALFRRAWELPEIRMAWDALTLEYGEL